MFVVGTIARMSCRMVDHNSHQAQATPPLLTSVSCLPALCCSSLEPSAPACQQRCAKISKMGCRHFLPFDRPLISRPVRSFS